MFDITSSKLLILGIVALLVIGPKDLPALLRTIGKYVGMIKRQAAEFRAQFDEAMRESELADLKRDVESLGQEAEQTMRAAEQSVERDWAQAQDSVSTALDSNAAAATTPPVEAAAPESAPAAATGPSQLNGAGSHAEAPQTQAETPQAETPQAETPQAETAPSETPPAAPAPEPEGQRLAAPQVEKSGA
jgi:sec-independent protein translocase protein TatB